MAFGCTLYVLEISFQFEKVSRRRTEAFNGAYRTIVLFESFQSRIIAGKLTVPVTLTMRWNTRTFGLRLFFYGRELVQTSFHRECSASSGQRSVLASGSQRFGKVCSIQTVALSTLYTRPRLLPVVCRNDSGCHTDIFISALPGKLRSW